MGCRPLVLTINGTVILMHPCCQFPRYTFIDPITLHMAHSTLRECKSNTLHKSTLRGRVGEGSEVVYDRFYTKCHELIQIPRKQKHRAPHSIMFILQLPKPTCNQSESFKQSHDLKSRKNPNSRSCGKSTRHIIFSFTFYGKPINTYSEYCATTI